jgi:cytochrome c peroxidase
VDSSGRPTLFTDFTYDNIGTPKNPAYPFYTQAAFNPLGAAWVDEGLGAFLQTRPEYQAYAAQNMGKMKVPTLRNVDKRPHPEFVKAYGHNGYFKSLEEVVHFYNTRDALPLCSGAVSDSPGTNCWPAPEESANVNTEELGNLGLSAQEEGTWWRF